MMEANRLRPMWIIRDYKLTPHSQWEAKDAQQWLFKSVEITSEAIRFDGQTCLRPQLNAEPISRNDFIAWTGGITPEDLKAPAGKLELVNTGCNIDALDQYIRLPDRRLVIQSHKVLFVLEPNVNY